MARHYFAVPNRVNSVSYRHGQAQILARQGIAIDRATLAFWVGYAAAEIKPMWLLMHEELLRSAKLFVEEAGAHRVTPRADLARARHGLSGGVGLRGKRSRTAFPLGAGAACTVRVPVDHKISDRKIMARCPEVPATRSNARRFQKIA
jgi:Transposase IS66 family